MIQLDVKRYNKNTSTNLQVDVSANLQIYKSTSRRICKKKSC